MTGPQKENEMFQSPETHKELLDYIDRFQGIDKTVALTVMGMTWNLATKLFNKALENNKNSIDEDRCRPKRARQRRSKAHKELLDYIDRFQGIDKTTAVAVMGMTWNLATRLFNKALKNNKNSIDEDLFECERCLGIFDIEDSVREQRKGPLVCEACSEADSPDIGSASHEINRLTNTDPTPPELVKPKVRI